MKRLNYQDLHRVMQRPDPDMWGEDEGMSYREAEALLMPRGPLSHRSLRTAAKQGDLAYTDVNGRHFTTKAAVRELMAVRARPRAPAPPQAPSRPAEPVPPARLAQPPRPGTAAARAFMHSLRGAPPG